MLNVDLYPDFCQDFRGKKLYLKTLVYIIMVLFNSSMFVDYPTWIEITRQQLTRYVVKNPYWWFKVNLKKDVIKNWELYSLLPTEPTRCQVYRMYVLFSLFFYRKYTGSSTAYYSPFSGCTVSSHSLFPAFVPLLIQNHPFNTSFLIRWLVLGRAGDKSFA